MSDSKLRPRAFRLDDGKVVLAETAAEVGANAGRVIVDEVPDPFEADAEVAVTGDEAVVETAQKSGIVARIGLTWGGLFWSAVGGLVSLSIGLWIDQLVQSLFEHVPALAWIAALLATLAILALAVLAGREFVAVLRQRHIAKLHIAVADARAQDDRDAARKLTRELSALYAHRPGTARARRT